MKDKKNVLEWIVFALATVLIVATVVVLARDAFTPHNGPPSFAVEMQATPRDGEVLLRLRVRNEGQVSAEHVRVEVDADPNVHSSIELDFVPRSSSRDAYVVIPATATNVKAHVAAWVAP